MIQRIYRITFLLFLAAGAVRLSAQALSSEVGVWVVETKWNDSTLNSENRRSGQFEEKRGYGISFNHFWTDRFSTELSAQRFSADASLQHYTIEGELVLDFGEVEATSVSATGQWHFNRAGRFSPYVGAGVTYLRAHYEPYDQGPRAQILGGANPSGPFTSTEVSVSAAAGVNVRITNRIYLAGDVKSIPRLAFAEGSGLDVGIDPLIFSAGVKVRF